ncbi:Uridine permease/thiamine transporter/allantoin transport [Ceraceosorus bombacis]|uniref:Uridine permease/thiamine transporter/allantoin transport n=1 Tax=Ceraceosorus bombacis TaxID=401625 RepID=A0A0N7LAZ2_9BASI|nr:Uridine permease/thiamine transporter/allantoin transport [Ceraceosorus bombacis]
MGRVSRRLRVPDAPEGTRSELFLLNHDLQPVPKEKRAWSARNFAMFWIADSVNINSMQIASSAMVAGLTWWEALIATALGYSITACFIVMSARLGAVYHVPFPVIVRSSFGLFGAIWPVINRAVMACVWQGVQAWIGGTCMGVMMRSIIPGYNNIPNKLSPSVGIESKDLLSFWLFGLINLLCVLPSPQKLRHIFTVKAVVAPIALVAFLAWTLADAGGLGQVIRQPATISGSTRGWAFVGAVFACISNNATLITNQADFARLSSKKSDTVLPQLLTMPLGFTITSLFGVLIAAGGQALTGTLYWDPIGLLNARLDPNPYDSKTRAACFFLGASFVIVQIGLNVAANSLSAGSDFTALLPRYINIRRGSVICWAVGMAYCPWFILSSSSSFTTYLSAYSLFLSSIIGVMMADYYVLRRGWIDVPALFRAHNATGDGKSQFYYNFGFNWRAYAGYVAGIAMSVTGFAGVLGANVSIVAERIYTLAFPIGFLVSGIVYLACNYISPVPETVNLKRDRKTWLEPRGPTGWEDSYWTGSEPAATAAIDEENQSSQISSKDEKTSGEGATMTNKPAVATVDY